jgi:hypothetical protein
MMIIKAKKKAKPTNSTINGASSTMTSENTATKN